MKTSGYIFDIKKYSINDGPGIRTTVFFKGCPLSCWWCHNPESQSVKPEKIQPSERWSIYSRSCDRETIGMEINADDVFSEIEKDIPFYRESGGGATFSGGEPLLQPTFLIELLKRCNDKNIDTAVDTSGFSPFELIEAVYDLTDLFLFDLKIINEELHKKYTGVSNILILENLRRLTELGDKVIIRMPVIPSISDTAQNLQDVVKLISSLKNIREVNLLPFHNAAEGKYKKINKEYKFAGIKSPDEEDMLRVKNVFTGAGMQVTIGG